MDLSRLPNSPEDVMEGGYLPLSEAKVLVVNES